MKFFEKAGLFLSILVIFAVIGLIVFSKNGLIDYKELKDKERVLHEQIKSVDEKNSIIEKEIISLKTDMEYIRHVAKHEHDMAEEGELIFKEKKSEKGTDR